MAMQWKCKWVLVNLFAVVFGRSRFAYNLSMKIVGMIHMCDNRSQKQHHKKVQLNSCKNQCAAAQMPIFRMYVSSHALSMCLCLTKCPEKVRYIFGNLIYFYLFRLRRWSRYPFLVTWPFKHIFIHNTHTTLNMKHLACRPRLIRLRFGFIKYK